MNKNLKLIKNVLFLTTKNTQSISISFLSIQHYIFHHLRALLHFPEPNLPAEWQKSQNPKQIVVGTVSNFSVAQESRKIDIISFFLVPKNNCLKFMGINFLIPLSSSLFGNYLL
jgi:hypothetical protein